MKLIVGLGNPGQKYEKTRHNIGFMVVEHFLKDYEEVKKTVWENNEKFKADIAVIDWQPKDNFLEKIILAKPKTFMNNSGMSVRLLSDFYKIPADDIWVVCDDVDLQLGNLRIRFGGASAGHRGTTSIIEDMGTDKFWRFRLGIGRPGGHMHDGEYQTKSIKGIDDFVLGRFSRQEWGKIRELIARTTKAIESGLEDGLEVAMNKYNSK